MAAAIADEDNHDDLKDLEITGGKLGKTYYKVCKHEIQMNNFNHKYLASSLF